MAETAVRVVIVEDHAIFADALQLLLRRSSEIEIVGVATDGLEAVDLALRNDAEVVLMDVTLPRCDGLEATRRLLAIKPTTQVIVLTSQTTDEGKTAALAAGAADLITKGDAYDRVRDAINRAAQQQRGNLRGGEPPQHPPS